MDQGEQMQAAANLLSAYKFGTIPDDPLVFSACYQLSTAIHAYLSPQNLLSQKSQYSAAIYKILIDLAARDPVITALIQTLTGSAHDEPQRSHHTPAVVDVYVAQTIVQGNQYNLSGDFRDAIVNISSKIDGTIQHVQSTKKLQPVIQTEIIQLLDVLNTVLQHVPGTHTQEATLIVVSITTLISTVLDTQSKPESLIPLAAELAQEATRLNTVLPQAVVVVNDILKKIEEFTQ